MVCHEGREATCYCSSGYNLLQTVSTPHSPVHATMSTAQDIDRIADEFEAAWQAGENPSIADYVAQIDEPLQTELLAALVPLDVTYCRQRNEPCEADDYSVFGDDAVAIARRELGKATTADLDETIQSDGQSQIANHSDATAGDRVQYFGEYELLSEIARGGMGVVYKARQVKLNRLVALKMILSGQLAGEQELKRFQAEAEAAAKLDHPGLVPIFEIGEHDGRHFIAMAYVEGRSLAAKLRDEGPMQPKEAAKLVRKITDAIHYAHLKGVVHRDLKPGNVLLDTNGEPRVTDFGLAKQVDTDSELTASGQVLGTPSYMPPEQAAGKLSDIGPASDIYSLGAILYACLTGRPPFQGASPTDVILQVLNDTPPAPRTLNRKVDRDLNTIVMKCLDKPIGGRYEKAAYLRGDLDHYLRGEPIQARPIGRFARTVRWSMRHKAVSTLGAALLFSLLYPAAIGAWQLFGNERTRSAFANLLTDEAKLVTSSRDKVAEKTLEMFGDPLVFKIRAGSSCGDEPTHFGKGARVRLWLEITENGESEVVDQEYIDLRLNAADVEINLTYNLVRTQPNKQGHEDWYRRLTLEVIDSNSIDSKSLFLTPITEFEKSDVDQEESTDGIYFNGHFSRSLANNGDGFATSEECFDYIDAKQDLTQEQREYLKTQIGTIWAKETEAERESFRNNKLFRDRAISGPLTFWKTHVGTHNSLDQDVVLYCEESSLLIEYEHQLILPEQVGLTRNLLLDRTIRVMLRVIDDNEKTDENISWLRLPKRV